MEFVIKQGDISLEEADALVNAAGTSLVMGSGVAGACGGGAGKRSTGMLLPKGQLAWAKSLSPRPTACRQNA